MAFTLSQGLGWFSIVLGVVVFVGAVAGVFFAAATPPLDVGATGFLVLALLGGAAALALARRPATA